MRWIAKLGQNIQFVAWWAHVGVANLVIELFRDDYRLYAAIGITVLGGIKEFWYDAKYETDPPQTFLDNLEDFSGWVIGAWLWLIPVVIAAFIWSRV